MMYEALIEALRTGDQEKACRIIDEIHNLDEVEMGDLSGGGRRYHLVHIASFTGQVKVLEKLIVRGVDLNATEKTHKGWTALHFASQHRHRQIAEILMAKYIDSSVRDRDGKTALDFAEEFNHDDIAEIIRSGPQRNS